MRIIYLWPKIVKLSANMIVICILCVYFVCLLDHIYIYKTIHYHATSSFIEIKMTKKHILPGSRLGFQPKVGRSANFEIV